MRQVGQTQGTFVHTSQENTNRILYCFQARGHASVSFNVHGVRHMNDDDETAPVEQEVRDLASGLQLVKDEQSYLVVRERVHRNTCESTVSGTACTCACR
jgi:hypothetical protein